MATRNGAEFEADETAVEHIKSFFAGDTSVLAIPSACIVCEQIGNVKSYTLNIPFQRDRHYVVQLGELWISQ
jgi:hypothetical protein